MEKLNHHPSNEHESHFYKGLFFGLLLGVGLVWFLNSEGGKELVKTARKKIDAALAGELGIEDYDIEDLETSDPEQKAKATASGEPRRFFQKKPK
ncbi:MAG TPA: hypothetical protein VF303_04475 [Candidatus Nanoarchaeia archaeon]